MVTRRTGRGKAGGDGLDRKTERIELNLWFSGGLGYHRGGENAMVGQEEQKFPIGAQPGPGRGAVSG